MSQILLYKQSSAPTTPAANKAALYIDNGTVPRLKAKDESANVQFIHDTSSIAVNGSTASVSAGYASDTYLAGSSLTLPVGNFRAAGGYYCVFDMVKTNAGTAAFTITIRMGTLGTTGDANILALAFAAGTAAVDTGIFEVWANFRTVGSGTSAVIAGVTRCTHHLAATGLVSTGASGTGIITGTSSGFNSTTPTIIGISVNGGSSFSGTNTFVQAQLTQ